MTYFKQTFTGEKKKKQDGRIYKIGRIYSVFAENHINYILSIIAIMLILFYL